MNLLTIKNKKMKQDFLHEKNIYSAVINIYENQLLDNNSKIVISQIKLLDSEGKFVKFAKLKEFMPFLPFLKVTFKEKD